MRFRGSQTVLKLRIRRVLACVLVLGMLLTTVVTSEMTEAQAQVKTVYTMAQARLQAYRNSTRIEQLEGKLETKAAQLDQAIKTIQMKKDRMSTFSWSPLLSFTFPTSPDLADEYEWMTKPQSIKYEIDIINHQIADQKFEIYQQVNTVYLDIVMLEKEIELNEQKVEVLNKAIAKSKLKLLIGQATQDDIDTMTSKRNSAESKISSASRNLISRKKRLVKLTKNNSIYMDYSFESPFVKSNMSRSETLHKLIDYTLDHDETYYEAKIAETSARVSLTYTYDLMAQQYSSSDMSIIRGYYNAALRGEEIDAKAFKAKYKEWLTAIDRYWTGKKRILFFRFPKIWFKGQVDGSRYVEDEPYALYEYALEYQEARLEAESVKDDLTTQVEEAFDNYISVKNSYEESVDQVNAAKDQLSKDLLLNKTGKMTYEEYEASLDNYETLQNEMFEAMELYSSTLYEFDRLTCGAVSEYLEKGDLDVNAGDGGESVLIEENVTGSHYYIEQIIQNEEFRLRIQLAEELTGVITDYELWCDDLQIGERTAIDKTLRHLALALKNVGAVKIRFYNDGEFVDECEIDPTALSGELEITTAYHVAETQKLEVGTYSCNINGTTGFTELSLSPEEQEGIGYYLIRTSEGEYLLTSEPVASATTFRYLSVLEPDLGTVTIEFYDASKNKLYEGYFDTTNLKLMKKQEAQ